MLESSVPTTITLRMPDTHGCAALERGGQVASIQSRYGVAAVRQPPANAFIRHSTVGTVTPAPAPPRAARAPARPPRPPLPSGPPAAGGLVSPSRVLPQLLEAVLAVG